MEHKTSIGNCPICRQGILEILKELSTQKLYICCDECEAEWPCPADALAGKNGSRNKYGRSAPATNSEIKQLMWEKFIQ